MDGAYFGTSVPHIFLKTYKEAVVLPPRIFHYEPKISGFRLFGKTGSRALGSKSVVTFPKEVSTEMAMRELTDGKPVEHNNDESNALKQVEMNKEDFSMNDDTQEDPKSENNSGKRNKKKNKKNKKGKN